MEPVGPDFFTDYLSHILLSGHSDSFSKYDKKVFLYRLPFIALRQHFSCFTDEFNGYYSG